MSEKKTYATCMTIAGSDPSGGAGIQADLKTFSALGCYGQAAITALTVQNTQGVEKSIPVDEQTVREQVECVWKDWMPDSVKIGITGTPEIIKALALLLQSHHPSFVVIDPVMVSSSGHPLMSNEAIDALLAHLFPLCQLITPNLPEMRVLLVHAGVDVENAYRWHHSADAPENYDKEMAVDMARNLSDKLGGTSILLKGGHMNGMPTDVLWHQGASHHFTGRRISTRNTHGTGCALSSAIAAEMAKFPDLPKAVEKAKSYVAECLQAGAEVWAGHGNGPICHFFSPTKVFLKEK